MRVKIGEAAELVGIPASTIRYYEKEGLVTPARVSGRRELDAGDLVRLRVVRLARAAGFKLAEIKPLLGGVDEREAPGPLWREVAAKKQAEIRERIAELERMTAVLDALAACRCDSLAQCVEKRA